MSNVRGEQMDLRFDSSVMSLEPLAEAAKRAETMGSSGRSGEVIAFLPRKQAGLTPDPAPLLKRVLQRVSKF